MNEKDVIQTVTVGGEPLLVSDLSIDESEDMPIPEISFNVMKEIQTPEALDALKINALVYVELSEIGGFTVSWYGEIRNRRLNRRGSETYYDVRVSGETERLSRIRFTEAFEGKTASQIIQDVTAKVSGVNPTYIQQNSEDVGDIVSREDTAMDVAQTVSKRTGWVFRVDNGDMYFEPAGSRPAPFDISRGVNLVSNTLSVDEDVSKVRNVVKALAYDYREIKVRKTVKGCTQSIYGDTFDQDYEVSGTPEVTSPEELKDVSADVDLSTGKIEFGEPLVLEEMEDPTEDTIDVIVKYTIRRPVLLERREESSISFYGERHGEVQPENGGDSVETMTKALESEIERKGYPTVRADVEVTRLGLRAGMSVGFFPGDGEVARTMRVAQVSHAVSGVDVTTKVKLTSEPYREESAVPELGNRVANLEKRDLHPSSVTGRTIKDIGPVQQSLVYPDLTEFSGDFELIPASEVLTPGGGRALGKVGGGVSRPANPNTGGRVIGLASRGVTRKVTEKGGGQIRAAIAEGVTVQGLVNTGGELYFTFPTNSVSPGTHKTGGEAGLSYTTFPARSVTEAGGGQALAVVSHGETEPTTGETGGRIVATISTGYTLEGLVQAGGKADLIGTKNIEGVLTEGGSNHIISEDEEFAIVSEDFQL